MATERLMRSESCRPSDTVILFDIDNTLFNTSVFKQTGREYLVFDEVHDSLEKLAEKNCLGILSQGEVSLQRRKIARTGIEHFFTDSLVHIVTDKVLEMQHILDKYKHKSVTLVDDKLDVLAKAKEVDSSVSTVWLRRGEYADSQASDSEFEPDLVFTDLRGLAEALL